MICVNVGDEVEKNEMAGHVAREGRGEVCTGFWWKNLRERDQWGDPGVDGRIILKQIFRNWDVGVWDWIGLAQVRDMSRAIVNAVMKFQVS
jgi:hypothetical protein